MRLSTFIFAGPLELGALLKCDGTVHGLQAAHAARRGTLRLHPLPQPELQGLGALRKRILAD